MRPFETLAPSEACFGLRVALAKGSKRVWRWYRARLTYKVLCGLDDRALKDIGICRPDLRPMSGASGAVPGRGDR